MRRQHHLPAEQRAPRPDAYRLIAAASTRLAASLDYPTTLETITRLAVPDLADLVLVDILDKDGVLERAAVAHRDPNLDARLRADHNREPVRTTPGGPVAKALDSGEALFVTGSAALRLLRGDGPASYQAPPPSIRTTTLLAAPLTARGKTLGLLTLGTAGAAARCEPADLALAAEIARCAALAVDNAWLYESAAAASRRQNQALSTVSHDLRTPLTVIKGQAQVPRRRAKRLPAGDEPTRFVTGLDVIAATAGRMASMIEELLDAARVELGEGIQLARVRTDLVSLTHEIATEQQVAAPRRRIEVHAAAPHIVGSWDPTRLARVLSNLIGNAVKSSEVGQTVTVDLATELSDGQACAVVQVRDRGVGIPEADLPRIFEPFHRGTNLHRMAGTGIGLAGAAEIVRLHGGTIGVESQQETGTVFTVRLPMREDDQRYDA